MFRDRKVSSFGYVISGREFKKVFGIRIKIEEFELDCEIEGCGVLIHRGISYINTVYVSVVVCLDVDSFPDASSNQPWSPIPSILIGRLSAERVVRWEPESLLTQKLFFLL